MRALLATGQHTIKSAGIALGIASTTAHDIAKRFGLEASPEVRARQQQAENRRRAEEARRLADRIRREIAQQRITIMEWARRNNRAPEVIRRLCLKYGVESAPDVVQRARSVGAKQAAAKRSAINAERKRITASVAAHRRPAAPPSAAEAEAAVAAFLARGGRVTVCPPAAVAPIHNGDGFA